MNDEQNTKPAAATDPQGRLDALVRELRARIALPNDAEVSDGEILEATDGTLLRASVELHLACSDLGHAVKNEIRPIADALAKAKRALSR